MELRVVGCVGYGGNLMLCVVCIIYVLDLGRRGAWREEENEQFSVGSLLGSFLERLTRSPTSIPYLHVVVVSMTSYVIKKYMAV